MTSACGYETRPSAEMLGPGVVTLNGRACVHAWYAYNMSHVCIYVCMCMYVCMYIYI